MPEYEFNVNMLSDTEMRKLGFTDHDPKSWFFIRTLAHDITFSLTIPKANPENWRIDVLDESFLQPFDFQYILSENPEQPFAKAIDEKVKDIMEELQEKGIVDGYRRGMYV